MIAAIDRRASDGDTLGGVFEVVAHGVPPGLGSYVQWDRKLDGRLAQALMSIPAIKGVGIGRRGSAAALPGSQVHDEILPPGIAPRPADARPPDQPRRRPRGRRDQRRGRTRHRRTEADRDAMQPLRSVDLTTLEAAPAAIERSDVCAVPAAAVVAEAMVALGARRRRDRDGSAAIRSMRSRGHARRWTPPVTPRAGAASQDRDVRPDRAFRRARCCTCRRSGRRRHAEIDDARRRHDRDDVRRARHRAGGAADRRALRVFVIDLVGRHDATAFKAASTPSSSSATACNSKTKAA